jgi:Kef-type K+ transport system membrane component KefB
MHLEPPALFFLQMAVILLACRGVGWIARRLGQPQVVGEMIAGVCLGPSLFGQVAPGLQQWLFPPGSLQFLGIGAQLGVGLYMFLVGSGFETSHFRGHARSAAAVSIAGMAVPFALAALIAGPMLRTPGLFSARASHADAVLFLGAAISITAFPMLARILHERGLTGTALGTLALAAGAIDDAAAWCILAIVLASFGAGTTPALFAIGGGIAYGLFMVFAGRPLLAPLGRVVEREERLNDTILGVVLAVFCLGAFAMDAIGIHAVFGGFLLGIAMPRGRFTQELRQRLEPLAVVFLLPMFFTNSGLKTRLDVMTEPGLLGIALLILGVSILGKGVACWAAARLTGADHRTSLAVGTLMNARGLMELIIINIGLQKGVIESGLFAMLVMMAIVTTLMATPLFHWCYGRHMPAPGGSGQT